MDICIVSNIFKPKDNFTGLAMDMLGNKCCFYNGNIHCNDDAAVKWIDGSKEWWFNGKFFGKNNCFTVNSWISFTQLLIFK